MENRTFRLGWRAGVISAGSIFVGAALLGGYAWRAHTSPPDAAEALEQVTIANVRHPGNCPMVVAQEKGFFAKEGVVVATQTYSSGKATLDAVSRGGANLAVTGDIPIVFSVMDGRPISIVATLTTAENDLGVVGRRDRGVLTPRDLKGKRVGVSLSSGGQFVLDSVLLRQHLLPSDIEAINLKPEELSGALAKGDIDAASTWQPFLGALIAQLGPDAMVVRSGGVYDVTILLAGSRDYVAAHPVTIRKLLKALIGAAQFCRESPDAARALVADAMKPESIDLLEFWASARFRIVLDQSLLIALEDETRWVIKNKLTASGEMPNYLMHIDLDDLLSVAPSAMTIIH